MKVGQLIEHLKDMDQDAEVHFAYNSGDYWRTEVAANVSQVDTGHVKHSEYHQMPKVVDLNDEKDDNRDEEGNLDPAITEVVLLS